ncbi:acyl-acyl carrier protein thioesterase ATL4, chloroplastic-like [Miscanthus floridulus]|uniref:acyl-acyl carrier protein thioesterase ATL4, chloroplastic-like n=1 Tax=Miscanthus floridulus TaxID=154761 RepID=UPI003459A9F3
MELGMRLRCCPQLPPNTSKPLVARAISAGAWRLCSSSHLAVLPGRRPLARRAGALQVAGPDSRPLETMCANNIGQQGTKPREDKFCLVEMEVRDCELDQYGLVSSAVYADYIENAREEVASRLGIGRDSIARTGNAMALSELKLNYFTPLKRGARFVVMVRVVQIKRARMVIEHFIETLPERKLVLEAMATVVFLNKDYRPTRVFPEVASKMLLHFF